MRPYGTVVDKASDADVVLIRLKAPFEPRDTYFLESSFHQGSLEFPEAVVDKVRALADDAPVVLDVFLERPAILGPVEDLVHALVGSYGASDKALLAALTGGVHPDGRLPFDIPASMAAVRAGAPDKADRAGAQHRAGTGLEI